MAQTLILDTSVPIAGLRSSLGASISLYGIEAIKPGEALLLISHLRT